MEYHPPSQEAVPPDLEPHEPIAQPHAHESAEPSDEGVVARRSQRVGRSVRAHASTFTARDYLKHVDAFWPMPVSFGDPGAAITLRAIADEGGPTALSILPALGMIAGLSRQRSWAFSIERLALLSGVHPRTAAQARDAFRRLGLLETSVTRRRGQNLTHWKISHHLTAIRRRRDALGSADYTVRGYFYFPLRHIYGANWAALSVTQRALYLAAATRAKAHSVADGQETWRGLFNFGVETGDVESQCRSRSPGGPPTAVRLADLSFSEAEEATGLSRSAIYTAVRSLKHETAWGKSSAKNDGEFLARAPLRPYPALPGYSLLYHFRDNPAPWPPMHALPGT